jgi:hypothetical protein
MGFERRELVSGFVGGLRQFADYLENDPGMAVYDACGDFFVEVASLMYDATFYALLDGAREELVRQRVICEGGAFEWDMVVPAFMQAVAEFACGGDREEKPVGPVPVSPRVPR